MTIPEAGPTSTAPKPRRTRAKPAPPRVVRPEPERGGPHRDGWAQAGRAPAEPAAPRAARTVSEAVRLGYSVVEENLRHGRRVAERVGAGGYDGQAAKSDLLLLSDRLVRTARDLGAIWFDLVGTLVNDPRVGAAAREQPAEAPAQTPPAANGHALAGGVPVPLAVSLSGRPATLLVAQLTKPDGLVLPQLDALRAADPALPAIDGVRLTVNGSGLTAVVEVRADQPPGTYGCVIADAATGAGLGMLAIRVEG